MDRSAQDASVIEENIPNMGRDLCHLKKYARYRLLANSVREFQRECCQASMPQDELRVAEGAMPQNRSRHVACLGCLG